MIYILNILISAVWTCWYCLQSCHHFDKLSFPATINEMIFAMRLIIFMTTALSVSFYLSYPADNVFVLLINFSCVQVIKLKLRILCNWFFFDKKNGGLDHLSGYYMPSNIILQLSGYTKSKVYHYIIFIEIVLIDVLECISEI